MRDLRKIDLALLFEEFGKIIIENQHFVTFSARQGVVFP